MTKPVSTAPPDLYDKPAYLIRRCHQIALALFLERCSEFDLTPVQYALLKAAESEPEADQITLAGMAALDRSNAARLAVALEARGLLHRAPDPNDRRARRLSLTAEGRALLRQAKAAVDRVQADLLAPLKPAERRAFMTALEKIAAAHNESSRAPLRLPDADEAA
jgi:MarR family transcriptional regulator, lower aerobic nicotinate degradation pathway regulator